MLLLATPSQPGDLRSPGDRGSPARGRRSRASRLPSSTPTANPSPASSQRLASFRKRGPAPEMSNPPSSSPAHPGRAQSRPLARLAGPAPTLLRAVLFSSRGLPATLSLRVGAGGAADSFRGDSRRQWVSEPDSFSLQLGPRAARAAPKPPAPSSERIPTGCPAALPPPPPRERSLARTRQPLPWHSVSSVPSPTLTGKGRYQCCPAPLGGSPAVFKRSLTS